VAGGRYAEAILPEIGAGHGHVKNAFQRVAVLEGYLGFSAKFRAARFLIAIHLKSHAQQHVQAVADNRRWLHRVIPADDVFIVVDQANVEADRLCDPLRKIQRNVFRVLGSGLID
jgi:hypothetical protein